ncbi:hypothetical protein [Sulfurovum sp. NBC37-1]|uniref:hypothetical protein n=1 Tax=Sulfurovum sp. (strain NBC37-1) TaxID=387093 RepID=UPI0001587BCB|nr:hypothetical protein [Sulfurovum sp. NBC37-1]BAF72831.1 hypothetical protein SUN_1884 [Sulfurovum sp. NBC37-1]
MKRIITGTIIGTAGILFLNACTGSSMVPVSHTPEFKQGQHDGCTTASGNYVKNSEMFRNNMDYQNGWFHGRSKCNK